jgi:hypothetical protein
MALSPIVQYVATMWFTFSGFYSLMSKPKVLQNSDGAAALLIREEALGAGCAGPLFLA